MTTASPSVSHAQLQSHAFLADMVEDAYFPPALVARASRSCCACANASNANARPTVPR